MAPIGWRVYGLDPEKGRLRFLGHSLVLVELLSLYSTEEEIHMWPTHINLVIQSRGSSLDATSHYISISEALSVFGVQPRNNGLYGPLCPLCSREINLHDQLDVMRPYWELDADTDTDHELVNTDELVDVMPNERVVKTVTITEEDLAKEKVCAICNRGV
ncbi:unnamed protein product [Brassica rapa]|uniref:Uncharacterized protein n=1 Tax=Brassica campestris TaxID=3711 RepID=A0A8D9HS24_BRACM|nr:unnamed protein product [Brassica rapa]